MSPLLSPNRIPDVSQWNGFLNVEAIVGSGVEEVIIRFGEGDYADPLAMFNWKSLSGTGVKLSAYWSIWPTRDANRQARYFDAMLYAAYGWEAPRRVWVDCEVGILRQPAVPIAVMLQVLDGWYPGRVGVYTRKDWWDAHVGKSPNWASKYHLWIADWSENRTTPRIPTAWACVGRTAELWQIGSARQTWAPQCAAVDVNVRLPL